jgi:hypothetical protein
MLTWPIKSPGEILDYAVTWTEKLAPGDAVKSSTWVVPHGLTKVKDSVSADICTIWLSGGKMNNRFTIINRVETAAGRSIEQYVRLIIGAK